MENKERNLSELQNSIIATSKAAQNCGLSLEELKLLLSQISEHSYLQSIKTWSEVGEIFNNLLERVNSNSATEDIK